MKFTPSLAKGVVSSASRIMLNPHLNRYAGERAGKFLLKASAVLGVAELTYDIYQTTKKHATYTVTIPLNGNSALISVILAAVDDYPKNDSDDQHIGLTTNIDYDTVRRIPSPNASMKFISGGHKYTVRWESKGLKLDAMSRFNHLADDNSPGSSAMFLNEDRLIVTCYSRAAREHLVDSLQQFIDEGRNGGHRRTASIYTRNMRYNEFVEHARLRKRELSTVILKEGQLERIIKHIDDFFELEDKYAEIGIPYKTGIMLYGPPGTGKTNLINALAHHYQRNAYIISLGGIKTGEELLELFSLVPKHSFLLLEDIDVAANVEDGSESMNGDGGLRAADLLNVLDGVASPHGLITIMTTNHREKIMPSLLRPGRVDLQEEITYLDSEQLQRIMNRFTGGDFPNLPQVTSELKLSPAAVVGVIRDNLKTPENTHSEVMKLFM